MIQGIETILLLFLANIFMITAWYAHLKMEQFEWFQKWPLLLVIAASWGIAFFEYSLQVPANKIGFEGNGGPFNLMQLKVIQEVITLIVFILFSVIAFQMQLKWNHIVAGVFLILAVYFVFGFK
ncbi:MAG: DMT family protein [Alistipes sp.]|nr:DMT family protein [Candidatus Alistipes equi]